MEKDTLCKHANNNSPTVLSVLRPPASALLPRRSRREHPPVLTARNAGHQSHRCSRPDGAELRSKEGRANMDAIRVPEEKRKKLSIKNR